MLGLIKRSFSFMDKEMFLPLYKALIRPHLEYATVVWSPFLKKDIFLMNRECTTQSNKDSKIHTLLTTMPHFP